LGLTRPQRTLLAGIVAATAIAAVLRYAGGVNQIVAFVAAAIALAGQAWIVSFATEQVGARLGPSVTGFMH
jgi:hypothetical protein